MAQLGSVERGWQLLLSLQSQQTAFQCNSCIKDKFLFLYSEIILCFVIVFTIPRKSGGFFWWWSGIKIDFNPSVAQVP